MHSSRPPPYNLPPTFELSIRGHRIIVETRSLTSLPSVLKRTVDDSQAPRGLRNAISIIEDACPSIDAFDIVFGSLAHGYINTVEISRVTSDQIKHKEPSADASATDASDTVQVDIALLVQSLDLAFLIEAPDIGNEVYAELSVELRPSVPRSAQTAMLFQSVSPLAKQFLLEWIFGAEHMHRKGSNGNDGNAFNAALKEAVRDITGFADFIKTKFGHIHGNIKASARLTSIMLQVILDDKEDEDEAEAEAEEQRNKRKKKGTRAGTIANKRQKPTPPGEYEAVPIPPPDLVAEPWLAAILEPGRGAVTEGVTSRQQTSSIAVVDARKNAITQIDPSIATAAATEPVPVSTAKETTKNATKATSNRKAVTKAAGAQKATTDAEPTKTDALTTPADTPSTAPAAPAASVAGAVTESSKPNTNFRLDSKSKITAKQAPKPKSKAKPTTTCEPKLKPTSEPLLQLSSFSDPPRLNAAFTGGKGPALASTAGGKGPILVALASASARASNKARFGTAAAANANASAATPAPTPTATATATTSASSAPQPTAPRRNPGRAVKGVLLKKYQ